MNKGIYRQGANLMLAPFKSGKCVSIELNNGKDNEQREELSISFLLGDDCGWYIYMKLKMPRAVYEFRGCVASQHVSKTDPFVWCKIVRMSIRSLIIEKLGIREPITFLRTNDYAWMDQIDSSLFTDDKWVKVE